MEIDLTISKNLRTGRLVRQREIPCICRIARQFEISFVEPLSEAHGIVTSWDRKEIEARAQAGAGGIYTHYCFGKISLSPIEGDRYKIVDLAFFYEGLGWCLIIIDGDYGPVGSFWDEEE